jgi:predicted nuclease of predicted toxin-antitoxin system
VKILVDMNLSPEWLKVLERAGWPSQHWSLVGSPTAADTDLFNWAREHGWVLLTQDLDFAELLFHTQGGAPSVVLLRLRNELDSAQQARVCTLLQTAATALEAGALLVIDERRARLRRLPITKGEAPESGAASGC